MCDTDAWRFQAHELTVDCVPVPGDPQDVKVTPINSTAIHVEWKPPKSKEQNGVIRGYHIHVQEVREEVRSDRFSSASEADGRTDGRMDRWIDVFVRFPGEGSVERADTTRRARRRAGSEHYGVATRHQILGPSGRSDEKGRRRPLAPGSRENSRRCAQQASR